MVGSIDWWRGLAERAWTLPFVAALTTIVLGATRVGDEPYWLDEATTAKFVDRPFDEMLRIPWEVEGGQGPFYVALWFWRQLFDGDAGMRMLAVVGGAGAAAALAVVVRRWYDLTIATVAVAVFVSHPMFLRYLTELRGYSWMMCASIVAAGGTVELVRRPGPGWAVLAGASAGLATATHYMAGFWFVSLAAVVLVVERRRFGRDHWRWLGTAAAVAAVVVAPFARVLTQSSSQLDWIPDTTLRSMFNMARSTLGVGEYTALSIVGFVAFVVVVARRPGAERRLADSVVLAMAVGGAALLVVASLAKPLLVGRYFLASVPFVAAATAVGVVGVSRLVLVGGRARLRVVPVAVLVGLLALRFVMIGPFSDEHRNEDARAAVEFVVERVEADDRIAVVGPRTSILHYLGNLGDVDPAYAERGPSDVYTPRPLFDEILPELERADLVYLFSWNLEWFDPPVVDFIDSRESDVHEFGHVYVFVLDRS